MSISPKVPSRPWLLPVFALAALGLMGAGVWMSLDRLGAPQAATPAPASQAEATGTSDTAAIPGAVHGRKRPSAFGLSEYPTAFEFHSMEIGKDAGSASFLVRRGTAAEVTRFYIQDLGAKGWEYRWKKGATARPGSAGKPVLMEGTRVRWVHRTKRQQMTLLALNDPQEGRTSQAVLSWSPM